MDEISPFIVCNTNGVPKNLLALTRDDFDIEVRDETLADDYVALTFWSLQS